MLNQRMPSIHSFNTHTLTPSLRLALCLDRDAGVSTQELWGKPSIPNGASEKGLDGWVGIFQVRDGGRAVQAGEAAVPSQRDRPGETGMRRERWEGGEARAPECSLSSRPIRAFLTLPLTSDLRTEPALGSAAPFSAEQRLSLWEGKRLLAGRGYRASKAGILAGFGVSDINNIALNESQSVSSVTQLCPSLCDPMDCSMPGFPVPELAQTHVHRVSDVSQPPHPLLSPSPPALNLSQLQGLLQ